MTPLYAIETQLANWERQQDQAEAEFEAITAVADELMDASVEEIVNELSQIIARCSRNAIAAVTARNAIEDALRLVAEERVFA